MGIRWSSIENVSIMEDSNIVCKYALDYCGNLTDFMASRFLVPRRRGSYSFYSGDRRNCCGD
jgi:hypothetical protein